MTKGMRLRLLQKHLHTHFIAALFMETAMMCPKTDEWIKQMCYLYTIAFYSHTNKNEILSFASKGIELENII
jgi:hypothetical protein